MNINVNGSSVRASRSSNDNRKGNESLSDRRASCDVTEKHFQLNSRLKSLGTVAFYDETLP